MKAVVVHKAGDIDQLKLEEVNVPNPKHHEVLIKIKAIGVNPVEYKLRQSEAGLDRICGSHRPVILGWDVAGVVKEVGPMASGFQPGDRIFGMLPFPGPGGGYAEYVTAPADLFTLIPESESIEEAAAIPLAGMTALQALRGNIKPGDKVLIHATSGGVGHYAVQIAKTMGAEVIGTSSGKNKDFVLSLGADQHIDYKTERFEDILSDVDFVLDGMAQDVFTKSLQVVKTGGKIVSLPTMYFTDHMIEAGRKLGIHVSSMLVVPNGDDVQWLAQHLANGTIRSHVSQQFSLKDMNKAHEALETDRTVGKIVVSTSL
jgi:NADPH:quinone reductase-like Zn-dependent oxidoreductase